MNKNELIISYEKVHNNKYDYSLIPNKDNIKKILNTFFIYKEKTQ